MSSRWMLRAAAAPERFLTRRFARFLDQHPEVLRRAKRGAAAPLDLGVSLPLDLATFLTALEGASIAGFVPRPRLPRLPTLLTSARRGGASLTRLVALLAGAVPFGETADGELVVYFIADAPANGVVATLHPDELGAELVCRGAAELAIMCSIHASGEELDVPPFGLAEEAAVCALVDRARELALVLTGSDADAKPAIRALELRPLDVPPPEHAETGARRRPRGRTAPLALGALVEAFFREPDESVRERIRAHADSSDPIVRDASALLDAALASEETDGSALAIKLARRRRLALRSARPGSRAQSDAMETTRKIVAKLEALPPNTESYAATHEREEVRLALAALGDRAVAPELFARAEEGDAAAVEMLAALGERDDVEALAHLLDAEPRRHRAWEIAMVRALAELDARDAAPTLRRLLARSPLTSWRAGLEHGRLVRELVVALGELEDGASSAQLVAILQSTSHEYRAILPAAAQALGRLRHVPALPSLESLLFSPKQPVSCEAVWAVGSIGQSDMSARDGAAAVLDRLTGLEPGAEATRLAALAKLRPGKAGPKRSELHRALGRALWEPAFRQEETSRRCAWGLLALEDLASLTRGEQAAPRAAGKRREPAGGRASATVLPLLNHEAIRHFITRNDHRVRRTAERVFSRCGLVVPNVRYYFSFALPDLEARGGLDALHEAVRDPLGVFRHNVAARIAEIGDPRSVRPLAEATARLFAEPPTSTYEYDDAPPHLVAFVRALAKLNAPEGNDVLIHGLRSDNHQVRAVIAENAPDDARFVPELMAMLEDPRSFLRSRAEKSLTSLGALPAAIDPGTTEIATVSRRLEM